MEPDQKTVLTPPWKELFRVASTWEYLSEHTHQEIAGILGVDYGTPAYYSNLETANEDLIAIGKRLKNIRNKGYRVLHPNEQTPEVVMDVRGVMRGYRNALSNLNGVPVKDLSHTEKGIYERTGVALTRTYSVLATGYNEAAQIVGISRSQKMLERASKK